jgi:taurine transport system substrate-binding protein
MSFTSKLSRREFGLLAGNVAIASLAGGSLFTPRASAQSLVANLSHYTSPNPQTYGKATGSFQKAFGDRAKANFVVVRSGGEVVSGLAGNSLDIAQTASSPVVVGYCNGVKASIIWIQKTSKPARVGGSQGKASNARISRGKLPSVQLPSISRDAGALS